MKNKFALLALLGLFLVGSYNMYAQESDSILTEETVEETVVEEAANSVETNEEESASFHQIIKQKFIEGGPGFMGIVLLCLILGLALAIERIIYLNMATTDTNKLLHDVESALTNGGVDAAKELCRNTNGPVASIFYQGLERSNEGIEMVEKSIISYGSVQMGLLEKGLSWISLFIALAPMLGFMGTVIGMIGAFDAIEAAGDISPSLVAGGIKVALLTTVFGLIVAMILQVFYNYLIAKVDSLVNSMEDASISLIDLLAKKQISMESLINLGIIITYLMVSFAALTAIGFGIKKLIASTKNTKKTLYTIGALIAVLLFSYLIASDEVLKSFEKYEITASTAKRVGMGLITFYVLAVGAIAAVLYAELSKVFSK